MTKNQIKIAVLAFSFILFLIVFLGAFEVNDRSTIKVTQYLTGRIEVVTKPGPYLTWWGSTRTYRKAGEFHFSKHIEDGGDGFSTQPIPATFSGRSNADITGFLKYTLPTDNKSIKELDEKYGSDEAIRDQLIRNSVIEGISQTSPMFTAEEADAPKRDQFRQYALEQTKKGIYKKKTLVMETIEDGKKIKTPVVKFARSEKGFRIIKEVSSIKKYNISVDAFSIKEIDWDSVTDELLSEKKKIDMKRTLSKAAAVTAQQNAIKEKAQGDARVARAEANALVEKKTAVIEQQKLKEVAVIAARKKYEVAKFAAKEALEEAKKIKAEGMAKAAANQALVKAGLTPAEKAEWQYKTAVGVAEALSRADFPKIMTFGGGKNSPANPLEAVGYNSMFDLVNKMSKKGR